MAGGQVTLSDVSDGSSLGQHDETLPGNSADDLWSARRPASGPDRFRIQSRWAVQQTLVDNANGSEQTQLTFGEGLESDPAWSPEGERIVYVSNPVAGSQATHIVMVNRRGGGQRIVTTELGVYRHPEFSPDGSQILFSNRITDE